MRLSIVALFILYVLISCSATQSHLQKTLVKGKVTHPGITELQVLKEPSFQEPVTMDGNRGFEVDMDISEPQLISFTIPGYNQATMYVEPGGEYDISVTVVERDMQLTHHDESVSGQEMYGSFFSPGYISLGMPGLSSSMTNEKFHSMFDAKKDVDMKTLNDSKSKSIISEGVYNLLKTDRECFYAARKATIASRKSRGRTAIDDQTKLYWKEIFDETPLNENLKKSIWFYEYAQAYLKSKRYTSDNYSKEEDNQYERGEEKHAKSMSFAQKHLSKDYLETYMATYINYNTRQAKFDQNLIGLNKQFKKQFPRSKYNTLLKPKIDKIERYFEVINAPFAEGIDFIENPTMINSLKNLTDQFKGQKLYVDIWASWCGPCKREFQFKKELGEMLSKHDVKSVYISIDKENKIPAWEEALKFYDLKGHHIRAANGLTYDLQRYYGGGLRIPYYLLIDENGKVVVNHASRPSQLAKLEQQIVSQL